MASQTHREIKQGEEKTPPRSFHMITGAELDLKTLRLRGSKTSTAEAAAAAAQSALLIASFILSVQFQETGLLRYFLALCIFNVGCCFSSHLKHN